MQSALFYPVYILLAVIVIALTIPRQDLKTYFIYGFILGGLGDVVVVALFQNVLHLIWFQNSGIFNFLGENLLSPPSWILTVMLYLRFLPTRKVFRYIYVLGFAVFSVGYGYLVHNVGLFDFQSWYYPIFAYFTFLAWWAVVTYVFVKTDPQIKNYI